MLAKPRRRRDPAKEKHWRRLIQRHQRSGLSVHAFCEKEGLKDGNFLWWRRELNRRDREKTTAHPNSSDKESPQPSVSPVFFPVRVVDAGVESARLTTPIEIPLPPRPDRAGPRRIRSLDPR
jgi:hypothetical protein